MPGTNRSPVNSRSEGIGRLRRRMVSRQRRTDVRRQSAILAEVRRPRDPAAGRRRLLYLEASARGIIDGHVPRVACRRSAPLRLPRLCRPSCRSDAPSAPGELDSPDFRLVPAQATVCGVQQRLEASRAPRQSRPARRPRPLQRIVPRPDVVVLQSAADAVRLHVRFRRRLQGALEPERIVQHPRVCGASFSPDCSCSASSPNASTARRR